VEPKLKHPALYGGVQAVRLRLQPLPKRGTIPLRRSVNAEIFE